MYTNKESGGVGSDWPEALIRGQQVKQHHRLKHCDGPLKYIAMKYAARSAEAQHYLRQPKMLFWFFCFFVLHQRIFKHLTHMYFPHTRWNNNNSVTDVIFCIDLSHF